MCCCQVLLMSTLKQRFPEPSVHPQGHCPWSFHPAAHTVACGHHQPDSDSCRRVELHPFISPTGHLQVWVPPKGQRPWG